MIIYLNTVQLRVKAILLLLFLGIGNFGVSQTYFSKVLPGWESSFFFENDTSYISFGMDRNFSINKNYIKISNLKKTDLSYLEYDLALDTQTYTQLSGSNTDNNILLDNQFYIAGDQFLPGNSGLLIKLDSDLDSIHFSLLDTSYFNSRYFKIEKHKTNQLLILGTFFEANFKINTFIKMMDTNGVTLWSKPYTIPLKNIHLYPKDIVSTSDKGFLLLCQEQEPELQLIGGGTKIFRTTLIKTDSLGNEQWRKHLGDERFNIKANNLIKAENDTSFYIGWTNSDSIMRKWYPSNTFYSHWDIMSNDYSTLFLSKIGESGKTQWIKDYKAQISIPHFGINEYRPILFGYSPKMIKTRDNHLVALGYYGNLAKFTLKGEMMWFRYNIKFDDTLSWRDSDTYVKTFKETNDNGFILGGQYRSVGQPIYQNAFAIKLDKYGCQFPGCHKEDQWYLDSVANAENKSNKGGDILLYPNPTNGLLTIKLPASLELSSSVNVSVFDLQGKLVNQFSLTDYTTNFNVTNLAKGMYLFQFESSEVEKITRKIIVN
ncbi:MAG: T9SS type A sorting domain-containing protein [Flavobacteriales bacterium]